MKDKLYDIEKFELFPFERTMGEKNPIPKGKGIYAWYLDFSKFKKIRSKEDFSSKIKKLDELISRETLSGSVKSFFKRFQVNLEEERIFMDRFRSYEQGEEIVFGEKIENLSLDNCKEIMQILSRFSLLVNPLYVGITTELRRRWKDHKRDFYNIKELEEQEDDENVVKTEALKKFGGRLAYRGFNWEYMIFACVETEIDRKIIQESEFLINRIYNPRLGRR